MKLPLVAALGVAACAGAPKVEVGVGQESILDLSLDEHSVEWTRIDPNHVTGVLDGEAPFGVEISGEFIEFREASGEVSLGIYAGDQVEMQYRGADGTWYQLVFDGALESTSVDADQFDSFLSENPEAFGTMVAHGSKTPLPLVVRSVSLLESSAPTAASGLFTSVVLEGVAHELLDIVINELVAEGVTHFFACNQHTCTFRCQDCCDATWTGHYPSLRSCYISCAELPAC